MTDKSTLQILKAARALITPEGAWTQGFYARTKNGFTVNTQSKDACSWCWLGAIAKVSDNIGGPQYEAAHDLFKRVSGEKYPSKFNDAPGRTQAEVLAKFDEAIAALEAS
jgi:hypothetical protein